MRLVRIGQLSHYNRSEIALVSERLMRDNEGSVSRCASGGARCPCDLLSNPKVKPLAHFRLECLSGSKRWTVSR